MRRQVGGEVGIEEGTLRVSEDVQRRTEHVQTKIRIAAAELGASAVGVAK